MPSPRSTLFPYTTLFRSFLDSSRGLGRHGAVGACDGSRGRPAESHRAGSSDEQIGKANGLNAVTEIYSLSLHDALPIFPGFISRTGSPWCGGRLRRLSWQAR